MYTSRIRSIENYKIIETKNENEITPTQKEEGKNINIEPYHIVLPAPFSCF